MKFRTLLGVAFVSALIVSCGRDGAEKKTVTFIGDSRLFCNTLPSRMSIPSLLQNRFTDEKLTVKLNALVRLLIHCRTFSDRSNL